MFKQQITMTCALVVLLAGSSYGQNVSVRITSIAGKPLPASGEALAVGERPLVRGTCSDPQATVWVVVHPLEVGDFWVQPRVTTGSSGTWEVMIYIGRPGSVDVTKPFEVRAVANPRSSLKEGDVLSNWPGAQAISEVIDLTRQ